MQTSDRILTMPDRGRTLAGDRIVPLLIGLTPALMTVLAWDYGARMGPFEALMRGYSLPAVFVELIVVAIALWRGFQPFQLLAAMPIALRACLGLLVAIAYGTALIVAQYKVPALLRTNFWLIHLLFGASVAFLYRRGEISQPMILWGAMAVGAILHMMILVVFVAGVRDPSFKWVIWLPGIGNVRHLGYFAVGAATTSLCCAVFSQTRSSYMLFIAAGALSFALIFWSGSRGALLATLAGLIVAFILWNRSQFWRAGRAIALAMVIGGALSLTHVPPDPNFGLLRIFRTRQINSVDAASSGRLTLWMGTIRMIRDRPVFGHGDSQFRYLVPEGLGYNQPHNALLQLLFQWGLAGTLCFGVLALYALAGCLHRLKEDLPSFMPALTLITSLLVMAMYDGALFYPYPLMLLALCMGMIIGHAPRVQPGTRER